MPSNDRFFGVESIRSRPTSFDVSEEGGEEYREEAEEAEDDDQSRLKIFWCALRQRTWWCSVNVARTFWRSC